MSNDRVPAAGEGFPNSESISWHEVKRRAEQLGPVLAQVVASHMAYGHLASREYEPPLTKLMEEVSELASRGEEDRSQEDVSPLPEGDAEPLISAEIDALWSALESEGISWFIHGGHQNLPITLAFEFQGLEPISGAGLHAMEQLRRLFASDRIIREAMLDFSLSGGSAYIGFGNQTPYFNTGEDGQ